MAYIEIEDVRNLTNGKLTEAKVSDDILTEIIDQATTQVNSQINVEVREEEVRYIDSWRKNEFNDNSTVKFYTKNGVTNYLGDRTDDGEVTTADLNVYKLSNEDIRTELTVSAINALEGSFTLSEAPGSDTRQLTITYAYTFYDVSTPDEIIKHLVSALSASWAYTAYEHGLGESTKFGNITFSRPQLGTSAAQYMTQYTTLLGRVLVPMQKPKVGTSKYLI